PTVSVGLHRRDHTRRDVTADFVSIEHAQDTVDGDICGACDFGDRRHWKLSRPLRRFVQRGTCGPKSLPDVLSRVAGCVLLRRDGWSTARKRGNRVVLFSFCLFSPCFFLSTWVRRPRFEAALP